MARLVVKIKYMKPSARRKIGRYAKYIGTREGVEKIDDSQKDKEATDKQKKLIRQMTSDFPELEETPEFMEYQANPTRGRATELIERALEESYEGEVDPKTYADYIATRPRAERIGKHGLFTDEGEEVNLEEVSKTLNEFGGTVWTAIVSLKREDAERLGFDSGARWRDILRAQKDVIAENMKIRPESFQWYAAFHNESYHPHVHLILYDKENKGYLSKDGMERIKSMFAHAIFQDEMLQIEQEKSERRDALRLKGRGEIEEIIQRIHTGSEQNVMLQAMLLDLGKRLQHHKGKKYYSYLPKEDKKLVDSIVDEIGNIPAVKELYDMWYEKQRQLASIYTSTMPTRVPLSANPVFKTLRNSVIRAAGEIEMSETALMDDETTNGTKMDGEVMKDELVVRPNEQTYPIREVRWPQPRIEHYGNSHVAIAVTRLLNDVSRTFREQFSEAPKHRNKVERKVWLKIREKEEAHGMKQG